MKRGTIEHPKTIELARLLGIPRLYAVGLLESIRQWCSMYAKDFTFPADKRFWLFTEGIDYQRDGKQLIKALIKSGWARKSHRNKLVLRKKLFYESDRDYIPQSIKLAVLSVGICAHCGSDKRLSIDHIIPICLGGGNEIENLQTLCVSCNSRKGGRP